MHKAEMVVRNAEAVIGMGMTGALTARWMADNSRGLDLHRLASRRSTLMVATTKAVRLLSHVAILAVGAILMLDQRISPGSMFAALDRYEPGTGTGRTGDRHLEADRRLPRGPRSFDRFFEAPPLPQRGMTLPVPQGRLAVEGVSRPRPARKRPC